MITTCIDGPNAALLPGVLFLYAKDGDVIADVTYGKGAFWKQCDMTRYTLIGTDILTGVDFSRLPYANDSIDIGVLDPPYMHNAGSTMVNATYNNVSTRGMYHKDIIELYKRGMSELLRVVRKGGYLFVKCQDEIESGKQCYSHIEIYTIAVTMGLYPRDMFVLHQTSTTPVRHKQQHAKKNHSYLWVLQKRG